MTAEEKGNIYRLLATASSWAFGYKDMDFDDEPQFEDDIVAAGQGEENAARVESQDGQPNHVGDLEIPAAEGAGAAEQAESGTVAGKLRLLSEKIGRCQNCILCQRRTNVVPGEGVENPVVMVIGEGPGQEEDLSGRPFVGPAGQLLDKMLAAISLSRTSNCYIANIVKCRPPENRAPMIDEANACEGYLQAQIHALKPKFILAMGRTAVQNLMKTNSGINSLRGKWLEYNGIPLLATYHPSALLRDAALKAPAWSDLKVFRERLLSQEPHYAERFFTQK